MKRPWYVLSDLRWQLAHLSPQHRELLRVMQPTLRLLALIAGMLWLTGSFGPLMEADAELRQAATGSLGARAALLGTLTIGCALCAAWAGWHLQTRGWTEARAARAALDSATKLPVLALDALIVSFAVGLLQLLLTGSLLGAFVQTAVIGTVMITALLIVPAAVLFYVLRQTPPRERRSLRKAVRQWASRLPQVTLPQPGRRAGARLSWVQES